MAMAVVVMVAKVVAALGGCAAVVAVAAARRPAHELAFFMLGRPYFVVAAHDLGLFVLPGPVLGAFAHEMGGFMREGVVGDGGLRLAGERQEKRPDRYSNRRAFSWSISSSVSAFSPWVAQLVTISCMEALPEPNCPPRKYSIIFLK